VARIELLNAEQERCCNNYSKLSLPETPLLLLEFHGSEADVAERSRNFGEIAKDVARYRNQPGRSREVRSLG
jgi:D-lactate dehydrogenase (cytochrome)